MRRGSLRDLPPPELPPGVALHPGGAGDEPALALLLRAAFEDETWTEERVRRALTAAPDVERVLVLRADDEIVATASARLLPERFPGAGYVHWVAVAPAKRGLRLGAAVTLAVLHAFRELGLDTAVLETDDHRLPAIRTYLRLGFEPLEADAESAARWAAVRRALGRGSAG